MAGDFFVLSSGLKQTATNAGATIVAAEVEAGFHENVEAVNARFTDVTQALFAELQVEQEKDNTRLAETRTNTRTNTSRGGGQGGPGPAEQGGNLVLKGKGKFAGMTIADVQAASSEEGAARGYLDQDGNGKPGRMYVEWLASDNNKNEFTRTAAKAFLEELRSQSS